MRAKAIRMKCSCGHFKTSHYNELFTNKVGCHAVKPDGTSQGCKCLKTQWDVRREWEREHQS